MPQMPTVGKSPIDYLTLIVHLAQFTYPIFLANFADRRIQVCAKCLDAHYSMQLVEVDSQVWAVWKRIVGDELLKHLCKKGQIFFVGSHNVYDCYHCGPLRNQYKSRKRNGPHDPDDWRNRKGQFR